MTGSDQAGSQGDRAEPSDRHGVPVKLAGLAAVLMYRAKEGKEPKGLQACELVQRVKNSCPLPDRGTLVKENVQRSPNCSAISWCSSQLLCKRQSKGQGVSHLCFLVSLVKAGK